MTERIWGDLVLEKRDGGMMTVKMQARPMEEIVRCRDCVKCRPTTDGRRYCSLWSHIVPPEGYCWRGEEAEDAEA